VKTTERILRRNTSENHRARAKAGPERRKTPFPAVFRHQNRLKPL
jgi:hypothetical protein